MSLSPLSVRPGATPPSVPGQRKRSRALIALSLSALMLAGTAIVVPQYDAVAASTTPASFADLAEKVSPSVVNISSTREVDAPSAPGLPFDFPPGSPFEEFFRRFQERMGPGQDQGDGPHRQEARALGSGFIIDPDGYVVTNNHVVDGADEIQVTLTDGTTLPAKLIGRDKQTDLALVKVETDRPLPAVEFGDSDQIRVGDWVIAVGNPFGLGGTVSAGIVSARGRDIHAGPFDDFLQIDAAINPGNSGGPTFSLDGKVMGVNTAIASPNGGNVGIGFAIPANMAKPIIDQLREDGSVERGWLGVQIQQVTPDLAEALGLDHAKGALVSGVMPDSPAASAGLRQGDVIVGFDGHTVEEMRDLPRLVAAVPAGTAVKVELWRDEQTTTAEVEIGQQEANDEVAAAEPGEAPTHAGSTELAALGAELAPVSDALKSRFELAADATGVVIVGLDADGPAAEQGLREGDLIEQVSQQQVTTPAEVAKLAEAARDAKQNSLLLLVNRQGDSLFIAVKLGEA